MFFPNKRQKIITACIFLLPSMLGLIVFCLVPMFASALYSFLNYDILLPLSQVEFVGLDNFTRLFGEGELYVTLWHNIQYLLMYI
ncbi:MAG: hypothetical protein WBI07_12095, partial [Mobilitalea sp.]